MQEVPSVHLPFCLIVAGAEQHERARELVAALLAGGLFRARFANWDAALVRSEEAPAAAVLLAGRQDPAMPASFEALATIPHFFLVGVGAAIAASDRSAVHRLDAELSVPALAAAIEATQPREAAASDAPRADPRIKGLIGSSPAFLAQMARVPTYAGCEAGVLILGETGTGKELFAQAVHYLSARASMPWVTLNCGAIPNELVEDELFGHVRGAYTTAHSARPGLVREAEGGSLFLDDIDCLPLSAQAKLLRFLQEREYRVVGSNTVVRADVRVVAASNRNLAALAAAGQFRQDLFFRLNVLTLALPPLRERREDIPALAAHFIRHFAREFRRPLAGIGVQALNRLLLHDWPGNVREFQHVIERAVLLATGPQLEAEDIDLPLSAEADVVGGDESLRAMKARVVECFERSYIERLLTASNGNVTHAALAAGKNRRAFFELIRKYRIAPDRFRSLSA